MTDSTRLSPIQELLLPVVKTIENRQSFQYENIPAANSRPGELEFLQAYSTSKYATDPDKVTLTADNVVLTVGNDNRLKVLLIQRGNHPFKGYWCLPGGFIDEGESAEVAAGRELAEETGVAVENLTYTPVGIYDTPWRDPRLKNVYAHAFVTFIPELPTFTAADDAVGAELFDVVNLLADGTVLGFDHELILVNALQQLGEEHGILFQK